jgi:hypothetical protein
MHELRHSVDRRAIGPTRYVYETALASLAAPKNGPSPIRVCLLSDGAVVTSEEQFNPFDTYRAALRKQLQVISLKLFLTDALLVPNIVLSSFDAIILKLSFRSNRSDVLNTAKTIRTATRSPIIYFDGDDDVCIQWPDLLPYVNLYVKKHVFRDKEHYARPIVGKSNLTDYVYKRFGLSFLNDPIATHTEGVPPAERHKIFVGCNLALDRTIMRLYKAVAPQSIFKNPREIDIIFRGNIPHDWMGKLREPIKPALERMRSSHCVITPNTRVAPQQYYQELTKSKICISPFGYGEICWRDFESILCGALLVKPDMTHVETIPDIFKPFETYVPVRWDYSDLEERCSYYLKHEVERLKITEAAFNTLDRFYKSNGFVRSFADILDRVSLSK